MLILFAFILAIIVIAYFVLQQPVFGATPAGSRLERIRQSRNYLQGSFKNQHATPMLPHGRTFFHALWSFIFKKDKNNIPSQVLPSIKTDLIQLVDDTVSVVWFGHSSYLIKSKGKNILVDPVFSGNASPFTFTGKSFKGSDVYGIDDLPPIDICIITHDHYDHMDYRTLVKLHPRVKEFVTSLGTGETLELWGVEPGKITELDWWESYNAGNGIELTAAPARHFSGRALTRNKSFWTSFILNLNDYKLYLGGDSGYDIHFKKIGEVYGPFDLAILECGQYNEDWPLIHMAPEETAKAAKDLRAGLLLPVHWAKFSLSLHAWNEPIRRVVKASRENQIQITTPLIGEPIVLGKSYPDQPWWE